MSIKYKILAIFIVVIITLYINISYKRDKKIKLYLDDKTKEFVILNNATYHKFKLISEVIYSTVVKQKEIIDIFKLLQISNEKEKNSLRVKLYDLLKDKYIGLNFTNLHQFHFQLPSNESFLRVHKPNKWGDNLANIRETIVYTNKYKKPIDGFELGRIHSGYRFVYPICDKNNNHLGSVEISFDISAFMFEFLRHFKVPSNIHISKEIIDKKIINNKKYNYYEKSPIEGYYLDKEIINYLRKNHHDYKSNPISNNISYMGVQSIIKNKPISLHDQKINKIITFLPITNPISNDVVAFFSIKSDANYIKQSLSYFSIVLFSISFLIGLIFYFIYRVFTNQNKLNKLQCNQNKLISMSKMIENIAHQYRQPLSQINSAVLNIDDILYDKDIQNQEIENKLQEIESLTKYMSHTVDDFQSFLDKNKKQEKFLIQNIIDKAILLSKLSTQDSNVIVQLNMKNNIEAYGYPNELLQVLLIIINNAQDIFIEKKTVKPTINIVLTSQKFKYKLEIFNNGGNCNNNILNKIFEPYFTTKHKTQGKGLGLYIAKMIIMQNIDGKLSVKNHNNGVVFIIEMNKGEILKCKES